MQVFTLHCDSWAKGYDTACIIPKADCKLLDGALMASTVGCATSRIGCAAWYGQETSKYPVVGHTAIVCANAQVLFSIADLLEQKLARLLVPDLVPSWLVHDPIGYIHIYIHLTYISCVYEHVQASTG